MAQTQRQALSAYTAIRDMGRKATGKAAFSLFRMKQRLKEVVEFQSEEELKLVEKFGGKVTEGGQILIADEEKKLQFLKEHRAFYDMVLDPPLETVTIRAEDLPEISLDEIEALDGFVIFE